MMAEVDPFVRQPNETFVEYLQRIKNVRGMLLGQYEPADPVDDALAETIASTPLGQEVVRDRGGDGDGAQDTVDPQAARQFNVERAIGLLTGKATPGAQVGSALGIPGMLVGGLVDYGAQSTLESELEAQGFTKEQIDTIKENPSILEGMMARGALGGFTQKGGYQQGPFDRMPNLGSIVDTILGRGTQASNIRPGYTPFGLNNRTAVPTVGMNPYAAPITAPAQYTGLPQGVVGGGQGYIDSSGQYRNTSNLSNQSIAGLQAVTAGMFETPSWYEDEYTEPTVVQDTSSMSSDDYDSQDSGVSSGGWSGSYDAGWT